ncbi:hypothetical protein C7H79_06940 [Nitrosomonas supralitoralis]|uniref:Uncharacterized protein n=1 Tax=Nitrosomonas supralitoralis TaxID=2116706 RepID=A0A2P7NVY7_9PROT|nr:hypothetical protein C7H79_06940 [Nitrosomonas supralitoralis]
MRLLFNGICLILAIILSGCITEPIVRGPVIPVPAGVAYVTPTYAIPGPGYVWGYHARFGWGWHHPQFGWHRAWR